MLKQVLSRRHFLQMAGVTSVSAVIAACAPAAAPPTVPPTEAPKAPEATQASSEATKAPEVTQAPEATKASAGAKKISISHIGGTSQDASDKSYKTKMFREAFPDIDIENRWIGYGAYVDKMPLMVASGDIADIQFCNAFNDIPLMVEAQIVAECDALLQSHGKDILACTPEAAWDSTIYDGKQMAMTHNTYNLNVWGIYYRKDWMDKVGLTKVPETIDEYGEALIAFTEKDPDGDGQQNTWGRSPFNSLKFDDDVYHAFGAAVGHHANGFWRERDGQIKLDWVDEGIKEGVAWFAKMYAAGAIEPDGIAAPIEQWGTKWTAGQLGTQYTSYGGLDGTVRELKKTQPAAAIVPGPAVKGPNGDQGFTGEGWPWCFVLSKKCQFPEDAMRMVNWFFVPETLGKTICQGELGITNKGLNDKGWCDEYSLQEIEEMGQAYSDKAETVTDLVYFGGLWNTAQTDLVPTILDHMPADMRAHFEGVLNKRMSPAAIEGRNFATEYLRLTAKKRPAPSEKTYWPALQTRFLEFLSQGAAGTIDLEQGWKDWLDFFEKNGGPQLTEEINAM